MFPLRDVHAQERHRLPMVMIGLLALNLLVFLYTLSLGPSGMQRLVMQYGLVPARLMGDPFSAWAGGSPPVLTLLSATFLHAGLLHLGTNLLFLWVFGDNLEDALGHLTFLGVYLAAGAGAGLVHSVLFPVSLVPSVGASGAIAGVLGGYILLFPRATIRTLLIAGPFLTLSRVRALALIAFWFLLQIIEGGITLPAQTEGTGGVAFFAHIGGFLVGIALVLSIRILRGEPLGEFGGSMRWGAAFLSWATVVIALTTVSAASAVLASAGSPRLAGLLQGSALAIAACFALADGLTRAGGHATGMGQGQGAARALAVGQIVVATVLLLVLAAVAFAL